MLGALRFVELARNDIGYLIEISECFSESRMFLFLWLACSQCGRREFEEPLLSIKESACRVLGKILSLSSLHSGEHTKDVAEQPQEKETQG